MIFRDELLEGNWSVPGHSEHRHVKVVKMAARPVAETFASISCEPGTQIRRIACF